MSAKKKNLNNSKLRVLLNFLYGFLRTRMGWVGLG